MLKKIEIICNDGKKVILTEDHVCYVTSYEQDPEVAVLYLSNGDVLYCKDPPFELWRNDCFLN